MKKLVLAMVSILLMALFIAFNYLLWDRENRVKEMSKLELENAGNNSTMSSQLREIKSLEEDNNALQSKINQLQEERDRLDKSFETLTQDKAHLEDVLSSKNDMLNVLKGISDIKLFEQPVKAWVDAINAGEYDKAYEYEYASLAVAGNPPGTAQYAENLKKTVKGISLKSAKLDEDKGKADGEIYLNVELDVKLVDKNASKGFTDGANQRSVKLGYDYSKKAFTILQITLY